MFTAPALVVAALVSAVFNIAQCPVPSAPRELAASTTASSAALMWAAPPEPVASYIIEAGSSSGLSNVVVFDTGSAATTLATAAPPGVYYVRVRGRNECGAGAASNEVTVVVGAPTPRPLPVPTAPLVLTGDQVVVIADVTYTFANRIELHDRSTLIIRRSRFTHAAAYAGQFDLWAYDDAKVIVEDSVFDSSPYVTWRFLDRSSLQMTNVTNERSTLWNAFQQQARGTFTNVSRAYCTGSETSFIQIDGARESFVEVVFPPGARVNESFPAAIGQQGYRFPGSDDSGVLHTVLMRNVPVTAWGITYQPQSAITISHTRGLVVTFAVPRIYSGITARFDDLRATLYDDRTWTTGNSILRLVDTVTLPWSPLVEGDNTLIITNSELADITNIYDTATALISDSSMTYLRAHNRARITVDRSFIANDVVAREDSVIVLNDTSYGGQLVREQRGQILLNRVRTTTPGFVLGASGSLTTRAGEVVSGTASIKGASTGASFYNSILQTDRRIVPFGAGRTYRVTFNYRIVTPASAAFKVLFGSTTGYNAGIYVQDYTIAGAAGQTGTATYTATLGPFDDYDLSFMINGAGVILLDDIQVLDVATGAIVASESAETVRAQ